MIKDVYIIKEDLIMSFSLNDIKVKKRPIKQEMSDFGKLINSKYMLTSNVKSAVWEYVKFRLFKIVHKSFTPEKFNDMIDDLMSHILHKDIKDITLEDVIINENEFIYEIANAIFYCNTHNLYYNEDLKTKLENNLNNKPKRITRKITKNEELEEYFKSIMV